MTQILISHLGKSANTSAAGAPLPPTPLYSVASCYAVCGWLELLAAD